MHTALKPIPGTPRAIALITLAAALAGCASTTSDTAPRADVHCVEWHVVPVVIAGQVHMARGACKAWMVGPTPRQVKEWDQRFGVPGAK